MCSGFMIILSSLVSLNYTTVVVVTVITVVISSEWDVVSDELLIEVISDCSTSALQQEVRNIRINKLHAMKCFFILISLKQDIHYQ